MQCFLSPAPHMLMTCPQSLHVVHRAMKSWAKLWWQCWLNADIWQQGVLHLYQALTTNVGLPPPHIKKHNVRVAGYWGVVVIFKKFTKGICQLWESSAPPSMNSSSVIEVMHKLCHFFFAYLNCSFIVCFTCSYIRIINYNDVNPQHGRHFIAPTRKPSSQPLTGYTSICFTCMHDTVWILFMPKLMCDDDLVLITFACAFIRACSVFVFQSLRVCVHVLVKRQCMREWPNSTILSMDRVG